MQQPVRFETTHRPRFSDLDPFGHVNTERYVGYFLEHRFTGLRERLGLDLKTISNLPVAFVIGSLQIEFLRPLIGDLPFTIQSQVIEWGEKDCMIECALFDSRGKEATRCKMRCVCVENSGMRRMPFSNVSVSPNQRSFPRVCVHRSSASTESQPGMWTPFVTYPTGTSASGQRGKSEVKRCRLTFPCSRLTPFADPLPRIARYAILNGSASSCGFTRPKASKSRIEICSPSCAYGETYWRISSGSGTSTAHTVFGDFDSNLRENRTERHGPYVGVQYRF